MTRTLPLTTAFTFSVVPTAHAAEPSAASKSAARWCTGWKTPQKPTEVVPGGGNDLYETLPDLSESLTAENLAAALAAAAARPSLVLDREGSVRETVGNRVSHRGRLLES
jgi:hypothetical protein